MQIPVNTKFSQPDTDWARLDLAGDINRFGDISYSSVHCCAVLDCGVSCLLGNIICSNKTGICIYQTFDISVLIVGPVQCSAVVTVTLYQSWFPVR